MSDYTSLDEATAAVHDPGTTPDQLFLIASNQPTLWLDVVAHPNAYPGLLDWLQIKGDATVQAAVATRRAQMAAGGPPTPLMRAGAKLPQWVIPVITGLSVIIVVLAVIMAMLLFDRNDQVGTATTSTPVASAKPATASQPATVGQQIKPPNLTSDGAAIVANPTDANAQLILDIHVDYQCPVCEAYEKFFGKTFDQLTSSGQVLFRYHIRSFLDNNLGNSSSLAAGVAATCADTVGSFQAYNDAIWAHQPAEGTGYTDAQLRTDFAADAGITGDNLTKFQACYDQWQTMQVVQNMETINLNSGVNATPTFLVNGKKVDLSKTQADPAAVLATLKAAAGVK